MPSRHRPKTQAKSIRRTIKSQTRPGSIQASVQIGYLLPAWDVLPPSAPADSPERQVWVDLSRKFKIIGHGAGKAPPGVLVFDITIPFGTSSLEGFPPEYSPELMEKIKLALPRILIPPGIQPFTFPPLTFPEYGDVRIVAHFFQNVTEVIASETLAVSTNLPHSADQDSITKVTHRVSEGPPQQDEDALNADARTRAAFLDGLLATVPEDAPHAEQARELSRLNHAFRQKIAKRLEPIVNARVQEAMANGSSLDDKKTTAKSLNEEMRHHGVAIRCEIEDKKVHGVVKAYPGSLVADTPRSTDKVGRFRLEYDDDDGNAKRVALPSGRSLVSLMAIPSPQPHGVSTEASPTFAERLGQVSARGSRPGK